MRAFMAKPGACQLWSCVARWHAAALYSKRSAGPSSRAAGFRVIAGWSCSAARVEERIVLSSSSFHIVDSLALLRTGGGADVEIRGAVEVQVKLEQQPQDPSLPMIT